MSNGKTHRKVGVAAGAGLAAARSIHLPLSSCTTETLGGAFGGWLGAKVPDVIDPPTHPGHRSIGHGLLPVGLAGYATWQHLPGWQTNLRMKADHHRSASLYAASPWERFMHWLMEQVFRLASGVLAGIVGGYASHLALDAFTPAGLPLLG